MSSSGNPRFRDGDVFGALWNGQAESCRVWKKDCESKDSVDGKDMIMLNKWFQFIAIELFDKEFLFC